MSLKQRVSDCNSPRFDNVQYNINQWYDITSSLPSKETTMISNQGINNDLSSVGNLYYTFTEIGVTETRPVTDPCVSVLRVGDSTTISINSNIAVNVRSDTLFLCCNITEIGSAEPYYKRGGN
jgi:hypothetical protein